MNTGLKHSSYDTMQLHCCALFTHDAKQRLVAIRDRSGKPAARFFLGRTAHGHVWRFRCDVPDRVCAELAALCQLEPVDEVPAPLPKHRDDYLRILAAHAPITASWTGPCYRVEPCLRLPQHVQAVDSAHAELLGEQFADWADRQPCFVALHQEHAAAVCASVRVTPEAHEAGVETLTRWRGLGYAASATQHWANAVHALGAVPLYSTAWHNVASQGVARRLGAISVGCDFHVT